MKIRAGVIVTIALLAIGGCASEDDGHPATLYRNSILDTSMRIHFASFDAPDKGTFNIDNCEMVARILNANLIASAEAEGKAPHSSVGFWCEIGSYRKTGEVPASFEAEYPTDS